MAVVPGKSTVSPEAEARLAEWAGQFYADPRGFVEQAYPWGEPGTPLEHFDGPDEWQLQLLDYIGDAVRRRGFDGASAVEPIRVAISSGHGVGKSTIQAWLVDWIMSTRPRCRGTVTANSSTQLSTKTWAAIQFWMSICVTAPLFEVNTERFYRRGSKAARASWFCAPQSSKKENSEAFAGQHAADSTSFYVIDEGSAVDDVIYDVAEGGLTDGEAMIFVFGNCTRSHGRFHEICFGKLKHRWHVVVIDARTSKLTNKAQIAQWIQDHGLDSDFVRVRVLGLPPRASDLQFIDQDTVSEAQRRIVQALADEPIIAGLDMARGGSDRCVLFIRQGYDGRSFPRLEISGEQSRDAMRVVTAVADLLDRPLTPGGDQIAVLFVDATGGSVGGPVADRLRQLGYRNVVDVQFGGASPDAHFANMRSYIWGRMRDWLRSGGGIPGDNDLEVDLTGPGYEHDSRDRLLLESKDSLKERGLASPDVGDALALTFAANVRLTPAGKRRTHQRSFHPSSTAWMGVVLFALVVFGHMV